MVSFSIGKKGIHMHCYTIGLIVGMSLPSKPFSEAIGFLVFVLEV